MVHHDYASTDQVCVWVTGGVMIFSGAAMNAVQDEMHRLNKLLPEEQRTNYWDLFNWYHQVPLAGRQAKFVCWSRKGE